MGCGSSSLNNNEKIEFHYFPVNFRGAAIRASLCYANVKFENKLIALDDWPKLKLQGFSEFLTLPVLKIGEKKLVESGAILRYIAKKSGLYGKDFEEQYVVDSLLGKVEDIYNVFSKFIFPRTDEEKENVEQNIKDFVEITAVDFLRIMEKRFLNNKSNYFVGNSFTIADIVLTVMINIIFAHPARKDKFWPLVEIHSCKLLLHVEKIKNMELKKFFEKYYIGQSPF